MQESERIKEELGFLNKFGSAIGYAVDRSLKAVTFGDDLLVFDLGKMNPADREKKGKELNNSGQEFIRDGNIMSGIAYLEAAHKLVPKDESIFVAYLFALCNSPRHFPRLLELKDRIPKSSQEAFFPEILAAVAHLEGNDEKSLSFIKTKIDINAKFDSYSGNYLAGLLLQKSNTFLAKSYFQWAVEIYPDDLEVHRKLAECHKLLGEMEEEKVEIGILEIFG